jgi:hypothetical protein
MNRAWAIPVGSQLRRCASRTIGTAPLSVAAVLAFFSATSKPLRASVPAKAREGIKSRCGSPRSCRLKKMRGAHRTLPAHRLAGIHKRDALYSARREPRTVSRSTHQRSHWALTRHCHLTTRWRPQTCRALFSAAWTSRPCANMRRFIHRLAHLARNDAPLSARRLMAGNDAKAKPLLAFLPAKLRW